HHLTRSIYRLDRDGNAVRAPEGPARSAGPSRRTPMLRSMFTAIGGLRNHQVMLDVTANNIANVNTVGYKSQRVAFESMMAQVMRGAAAPVQGTIGGSGPTEVGLGMTLNSIGSIMTQGSLQTTGQWSDIGLNGDGYFMVATGLDATDLVQTPSQIQLTRA